LSFHLCTAEQEDNLSAGKCEFGSFSSIGGSSPARKRRRTQILKPARERTGQQNETINQKKGMSNLNVTVLVGRLVRTPIIRINGSKMGFFYIASNRRYRDKAEVFQEETAFVACKCFGAWTDALARHQKGDIVMLEGRLRTETWNNEGTSRWQLILVCDSVQLLSQNHGRKVRRSPTTATSTNTRRLLPVGKPTASRRFERRTHQRHSQFVRAKRGYPLTGSAKSDTHGRICAVTCSVCQSGPQNKNEVGRNPPVSNSTSQP
jgi:single stranded DNA-binding protein